MSSKLNKFEIDSLESGHWLSSPPPGEEVVISGISGTLPESYNVREYAQNLYEKREMVRSDNSRWPEEMADLPKAGGRLPNLKKFDLGYFGMHYKQAYCADFLVRLPLERAVEAIIDAGINPKELEGTRTAVFSGCSDSETEIYWTMNSGDYPIITGNNRSMIPNRVSYFLKLNSLSHTVDTACSSSHYAIENALYAIRRGLCDQALVLGVNVLLHSSSTRQFYRLGVLNKDGKCKVFDDDADGYSRTECCCAIFLQKAKNAKRNYAQVVHAKTNSDGFKVEGITFPSSEAQSMLLKDFYDECGIDLEDMTFMEAHGTGTAVGDPAEATAIDEIIAKRRKTPLLVGSVKSNLGHSEPSAGLAAVIKVIFAMENELIPPNINFKTINKKIRMLAEGRAKVILEATKLPNQKGLMGINGFGFGGANAHVLLRWNENKKVNRGRPLDNLPRLVCISARIEEGIDPFLNDIKTQGLDAEYIRLFHDIFRIDMESFHYRGFIIIDKHGEITRSSKLLRQKPKIILWFGDLSGSWIKVMNDIKNLTPAQNCIKKINGFLEKKVVNIPKLLDKNKKYGKDIMTLGEFITKLVIANILREINFQFDSCYGFDSNKFICAYLNGSLQLEDAIELFLNQNGKETTLKEYFNNPKLDDNQIAKLNRVYHIIYEIGNGSSMKRTTDAAFKDPSKDALVSLLEFLGRAYLSGVSVNLANLYPPVKFPVSRGTPSISPLVKWKWNRDFQIFLYNIGLQGLNAFDINSQTNEWSYLLGHVIDGRVLFPAIAYLYLAWNYICDRQDQTLEEHTVVMENMKFLRATNVSPNQHLRLILNFKTKSFEVLEDTTVLVTGCIRMEKRNANDASSIQNGHQITNGHSEESLVLDQKDVYKELRLRGYNYCNEFKKIKEYDMVRSRGKMNWDGNWVTFIDNMLQMLILELDTRSLFVPTGIKYLKLDIVKHLALAKQNSEFTVEIDKESDVIRTGGIELRGLKASAITRRKEIAEPVLEKYEFVPNEAILPVDVAIRVDTQIIVENWPDNKFKILEYCEATPPEDTPFLCPLINDTLSDLPLLQPDIAIFSKTNLAAPEGINQIKEIPADSNYVLLIVNELYKNYESYTSLIKNVTELGFILSRESANFQPLEHPLQSLQLITVYRTGKESLVLLKKMSFMEPIVECIDVSDTNNFEWIPKLKQFTQNNESILVYAQGEVQNGVLGLINCLKREPTSKKARGVLIEDSAPTFDMNDPFYLKQLKRGLSINVYKNGRWGTYRHLLLEKDVLIESEHSFVNITQWGDLKSLAWFQGELTSDMKLSNSCEEIIHIYYGTLNFKDVMLASGRINYNVITYDRRKHEKLLGFEFSGRTTKGERVMGIFEGGSFATMAPCSSNLLWKIPDNWSLEDAATIPCVYTTAAYAIFSRGNGKRGDRILIHSGTGGVGLAAINLCLFYGIEIFTTVGTQEKREYLRKHFPTIPDDHIGNSRDTSFEEMVKMGTKGEGVDLVLNSLAEEKLLASVRCLARGGRFLEIGKFDLANDNSLHLELLKREGSYHGVMLDRFLCADEDQKMVLKEFLQQFINDGAIKPLDRTIFLEDECEKAMRYMMAGKHIGKVLLKIRDEEPSKILPKVSVKTKLALPRYSNDPEKVVVILGGLGGFGLELADWLVIRGARKLVLTSRSGAKTGYQKMRLKTFRSYGCQIHISTADITKRQGCEQLITEAMKLGTIQAIFNLAVVLQDSIFENQDEEKFKISLAPKAYATKYLDEITRKRCKDLEDFVVFSSVSCGRGNAGQTNYGMANSIMERICEQRRHDGLPGLAIQWGAVGDVGLVADMQDKDETLEIGGTLQQRITSCLSVMDKFLRQPNPIVSSMVVAEKRSAAFSAQNLLETVGRTLGIKNLKTVSPHSKLSELGMDSIIAVEIKQIMEQEIQLTLTTQELREMTFARLKEIQDQFTSEDAQTDKLTNGIAPAAKELNISDYGLLQQSFMEESDSTQQILKLPNKGPGPKVMFFPGLEGNARVFEPIIETLKVDAYCFQYIIGMDNASVERISEQLLPIVLDLLQGKTFFFVGYSYGGLVSLYLSSILEKRGYKGSIFVIDSSPDVTKKLKAVYATGNLESNLALQGANTFLPKNVVISFQKTLSSYKTYDEKLEALFKILPKDFHISVPYLRQTGLDIYHRLLSLDTFKDNFKIKTNVTLAKSAALKSGDFAHDYGLSRMCEGSITVYEFAKSDHVSILKNGELHEAIAKWLKENAR